MKRIAPLLVLLSLSLITVAAPTSKSRSSSSPSKSSSPSHSSSGWGSSSKPSSRPSSTSGWGSSTRSSRPVSKPASKIDATLAVKVRSNDYSAPRAQVVREQQTIRSSERIRYRYDREPTVWPSLLPHRYYYGSSYYDLIWDPYYRGYGWYGPNRTWIYYDTVYVQPGAPVQSTVVAQPVVAAQPAVSNQPYASDDTSGSSHSVAFLFLGLLILALIALCILFFWNRAKIRKDQEEDARLKKHYQASAPITRMAYNQRTIDNLQVGDVVSLRDRISLADAQTISKGARGLSYVISSVLKMNERHGYAKFTFFLGKSAIDQELLIMIKDVGDQRAISYYTQDVSGSRKELIDNREFWLFAKPDADEFDVNELQLTQWFDRSLGADQIDRYQQKDQGVLNGLGSSSPDRGELLISVAEYTCDRSQDFDQYLILESGPKDGESILQGWWGTVIEKEEFALI